MLVRALLLLLLFMFLARAAWRLLEGVVRGAVGDGDTSASRSRPGGPAAVKMARCPVCGTYVVPGRGPSAVNRGQAVYFCSEACRAKFAA